MIMHNHIQWFIVLFFALLIKCILTFNDLTKTKKMWGNQYCFKSKKAIELLNKNLKEVIIFKKSNN